MTFFDDKSPKKVFSGGDHAGVLTGDGTLWIWGFGQHGTAGDGEASLKTIKDPIKVLIPNGQHILKLDGGLDVTLALTTK